MPETTVQIEVDGQGKVMVGMVPPEAEGDQTAQPGAAPDILAAAGGEEQAEQSYMKPVGSLDEALQVAKDMLSGATGQQAQQANAEDQFKQGFGKPQPSTMMQGG